MASSINQEDALNQVDNLDNELSKRFISLDPSGYFLIKLDETSREIVVEHYPNDIDAIGRAIDPETKQPLSCQGEVKRNPKNVYKGRTA